jgi:hypothetical protein
MKFFLPLIASVFLLAGCESVDLSQTLRASFSAQAKAWNDAGVDFEVLPEEKKPYAIAGCFSLTSLSTVLRPDATDLNAEVAAWCSEAIRVAGKAE